MEPEGLKCPLPEKFSGLREFDLPGLAIVGKPVLPQEAPAQDHAMPLITLAELHPREGLEEQPAERGNPQPGQVDKREVFSANPADLTSSVMGRRSDRARSSSMQSPPAPVSISARTPTIYNSGFVPGGARVFSPRSTSRVGPS